MLKGALRAEIALRNVELRCVCLCYLINEFSWTSNFADDKKTDRVIQVTGVFDSAVPSDGPHGDSGRASWANQHVSICINDRASVESLGSFSGEVLRRP